MFATNLAIPKQRMTPTDKTTITFYEMPGGGPEPIRSWFYPGDTIGQEFVYSRARAREIALATRENVPVLAEARQQTSTQESTASQSTASTETAAAAEVTPPPVEEANREMAEATPPPPPPAAAEEPAAPTPAPAAPEPAMPKTAGDGPTIALLGLTCLGIALSIRFASRHAGNQS